MFKKFGVIAVLAALVATAALSASRFKTDQITAEDGGPVSAVGGLTVPSTGTFNAAGVVDIDGTLTGDSVDSSSNAAIVVTAGSNAAAVTTPATFYYTKVGDIVHAWGVVNIDPTSDDTDTVFTLSLPVTRATNFSGTGQGHGAAIKLLGEGGSCTSTNSAKTMTCTYFANGTAAEDVRVWFTYLDD